jgi:gamma-glutamyl:cysteine ligase YbdK (ATP-grasp superfamily)
LVVGFLISDTEKNTPVGDLATTRVYGYNRFQACRFGFDAQLANPHTRQAVMLSDSLHQLLTRLMPVAAQLGTVRPLMMLQELAAAHQNGASWMRAMHAQCGDLREMVIQQAELFRNSTGSAPRRQTATGAVSEASAERREPKLELVQAG